MNSHKKVAVILSLGISLVFSSTVSADTYGTVRGTGGHSKAWYDSSVASYGFGSHYDHAIASWNGRNPNVSITKTTVRSGSSTDEYYVGTTSDPDLYGHTAFYNSLKIPVNQFIFNWNYCVVSLYYSTFKSKDLLKYPEIIKHTTTHEVGHTLGLTHTTASAYISTSLMTAGNTADRNINTPSAYDISELRSIWGGPAYKTLELLANNPVADEIPMETVHATQDNFTDLEKTADLVVVASATNDFVDRPHINTYYESGALQDFYTLTNVEIKEVLKGDLHVGANLEIAEPNGVIEVQGKEVKLITDGYENIVKDQDYVLFLKLNSQGQYFLTNRNNGKFDLEEVNSLQEQNVTFSKSGNNSRDSILNGIYNNYFLNK